MGYCSDPTIITSVQVRANGIATPTHISSDAKRSTRPRGMTDVGPSRPRPTVEIPIRLVRQSHISRTLTPAPPNSPPPAHALPPVPLFEQLHSPVDSSMSPSSLSNSPNRSELDAKNPITVSSFGAGKDENALVFSQRLPEFGPGLHSSRTCQEMSAKPERTTSPRKRDVHELKKSKSQYLLSNRTLDWTFAPMTAVSVESFIARSPPLRASDGPKKQRSFHHVRKPAPPVPPLRHANSFNTSFETTPPVPDISLDKEKQKAKEKSGATWVQRRHFFPGSSRKSSSRTIDPAVGDDSGSIVDSRPNSDEIWPTFINPFSPPESRTMSPALSAGEEFSTAVESRRPSDALSIGHVSQQIMSPADMLKLEAKLRMDEDLNNRTSDVSNCVSASDHDSTARSISSMVGYRRGSSFTDSMISGSTAFSDKVETPSSISFLEQHSVHLQGRVDFSGFSLSQTSEDHESTKFESTSLSTINVCYLDHKDDQSHVGNSLPPPPRPRNGTSGQRSTSGRRSSAPTYQSVSPPFRRRATSKGSKSVKYMPASPDEPSLPSPVNDNNVVKHFMLRKPSFLEIEDEAETVIGTMIIDDFHQVKSDRPPLEDSFLDLGRGGDSIDTIRTTSAEGPDY
jgi:hypothetical protein